MTPGTLKFAGLTAMASAFLTVPLVYLSLRLQGMNDSYGSVIQAIIQIFGTILFIVIVRYLKKFLHFFFSFRDTDRSIDLMILASILTGVLSLGVVTFPAVKESLESAVIVILVALGLVQVQFGFRLLKLSSGLGGLLRPFCYANMAAGIFLASVVLMPLSIIVSALSDLMLGTIFFNMSRLTRTGGLPKE